MRSEAYDVRQGPGNSRTYQHHPVHFDWTCLEFPKEKFDQLQLIDRDGWRAEAIGHQQLFMELHDRLTPEMVYERELLICRL
jgi:phosphoenolpyruvate carboxykinase (GTP)